MRTSAWWSGDKLTVPLTFITKPNDVILRMSQKSSSLDVRLYVQNAYSSICAEAAPHIPLGELRSLPWTQDARRNEKGTSGVASMEQMEQLLHPGRPGPLAPPGTNF